MKKERQPKGNKDMPEKKVRKTSMAIPESLWRAAHIKALDENCDLQDIIARALEAYLKTPRKESK